MLALVNFPSLCLIYLMWMFKASIALQTSLWLAQSSLMSRTPYCRWSLSDSIFVRWAPSFNNSGCSCSLVSGSKTGE